jgi:HEAT repeat protein
MWEELPREKPLARREHARSLGVVAHLQRDSMSPFLPKTMTALVKRLKDSDVLVREAASESIGKLCRYVPPPVEGGTPLSVFFKPLFHAMESPNREWQHGAGLAIAHVVQNAHRRLSEATELARFLPRLLKAVSLPESGGQAPLLHAIALVVSHLGAHIEPQPLQDLTAAAIRGLQSLDRNARQEAAGSLEVIVTRMGPTMSVESTHEVLQALELHKYDKVVYL